MTNNYKKNITVIEKLIPDLYKWIEEQDDVDWIKPIRSKNGDDNFNVFLHGQPTLAYNIDNARKDSKTHIKDRKILKEDVTVLIGFGLGYMCNQLIKQAEKGHHVIVIEPVAHIIKMALSKFDFSKYLENGQLTIVAPGIPEIQLALSSFESIFVVRNWDVIIEHYIKFRPEYSEISVKTLEIINSLRCNTGTVASNGHIIASNDIESLPYLIRHRGIAELVDLFKGKPAVIVSTGPSLEKNLHHLIEWQDKVVIVAVGQALRPLLAYGITPDFICTVDFGEVNMGHFEGILDSQVPLICLNRAYAPLLKKYQGQKFVVATPNPGYENTAVDILAHRGSIDQFGSVAHLCLGSAYLMGCDPIIIIGQDLAYPDKNMKSHFSQADEMGDIEIDENNQVIWKVTDKKSILHGKQDYNFGQYVSVSGYFGKPVKTNIGLASFINGFENQIKSFDPARLIINATQGGAKINGARQWGLITALTTYYRELVDKSRLAPLLSYADDAEELIKKVLPLLKTDIKILDKIISHCQSGLRANVKLSKKGLTPQKIVKYLKDNKIDSEEAYKLSIKIPLVNVAIFGANRQINSKEMAIKKLAKNVEKIKNKDLKSNLNRNRFILQAAKRASQQLVKEYRKTHKLLFKYSKNKDDGLLRAKYDKSLDNVELGQLISDLESDNFSRPLLSISKLAIDGLSLQSLKNAAEKMKDKMINNAKKAEKKESLGDIRYYDLIEYAQQVGRDNQDFEKAEELLNEAFSLKPKGEEIRYGLACLHRQKKNINKSRYFFDELIKEFPKNHTYLYEYGTFLIGLGEIEPGIKSVIAAMQLTEKYDAFFKQFGNMYASSGDYEKALPAYEQYLEKFPTDLEVWGLKLEVLFQSKAELKEIRDCQLKIDELKGGKK